MKKSKFNESQIIGILKQQETGTSMAIMLAVMMYYGKDIGYL